MLLGITVVFALSVHSAKKYVCPCWDLMIIGGCALLVALPAGSLLYIAITYDFATIASHIIAGNFEALGGSVFYGALIGGILGGILGIHVAKANIGTVEKTIIPYIPIGHAVGRIGCLLAGCCYGMKYSGPFAVYYPNSIAGAFPQQGYFPVQILEAMLNVIISLILTRIRNKTSRKFQLLAVYLMFYGFVRFLLELLRGDAIRGFYFGISTSQWISLGLFAVSLSYIICLKLFKSKATSVNISQKNF